jgi:hypothetical protein
MALHLRYPRWDRHRQVGGCVDEYMADAIEMLDHGHLGLARNALDEPLPPRAITSTCLSSLMRQPTAARSVVAITTHRILRQPAGADLVDARGDGDCCASPPEPPRRIVALPAWRRRPAASAVTLAAIRK